jgi:8-oxo-dGTP pyrophosphatase MutT (NUDIX family)
VDFDLALPLGNIREKFGGSFAVIFTQNDRYLLQHRDDDPAIWFPNYWGLFGGAREPNETLVDTLRREIKEEISFEISEMKYFIELATDLNNIGGRVHHAAYFEVPIEECDVDKMILNEGEGMRLFTPEEIEQEVKIHPYDKLALTCHFRRDCFVPAQHSIRN